MEIQRSVDVPAAEREVFAHVDDLDRYRPWMALVHDVAVSPTDDGAAAWDVELRAQVGPFARSKRLRMVRTHHEPPHLVAFERRELDGREHAPWILRAEVASLGDDSSRLTMQLTYGGRLWAGAVLGRVLDEHIEQGAAALVTLLADRPA